MPILRYWGSNTKYKTFIPSNWIVILPYFLSSAHPISCFGRVINLLSCHGCCLLFHLDYYYWIDVENDLCAFTLLCHVTNDDHLSPSTCLSLVFSIYPICPMSLLLLLKSWNSCQLLLANREQNRSSPHSLPIDNFNEVFSSWFYRLRALAIR